MKFLNAIASKCTFVETYQSMLVELYVIWDYNWAIIIVIIIVITANICLVIRLKVKPVLSNRMSYQKYLIEGFAWF